MAKIITFIKKNVVMSISFVLVILTSIFVPIDKQYISYFDFKTLTCLFCSLVVICALKNINFFQLLAKKIVCIFKNTRSAIIALVYITFIGSMLIANDMALITFLPLGYFVLSTTNNKKYMAFTFIMQNIAANLGGMLTPFGNPQNLYLYTYFNITNKEFLKIMMLPFIISITLITICCLFVKKDPLILEDDSDINFNIYKTIIYLILFAFSITIVFRIIPYYWGLILIPLSILILDYKALKIVDYPLILTFCAFFIFSGNMARIPAVNEFLSNLIQKNTLLYGVLSCQLISNVPSAVLLSKFTNNYQQLLVAVNIGGAGTLIASLASLITFREYLKYEPKRLLHYLKEFSVLNFGILIVLLVTMNIIM